jgi:hypothetical protein
VYISDPNSVAIDVVQTVPSEAGAKTWLANYSMGGKVAKFRIELMTEKSEGAFVAEPGSDGSILLADLKKALDAKHLPSRPARAVRLEFSYIALSERMSQTTGGGFLDKPPGDWVLLKLFMPARGDDCELYLNMNPVLGLVVIEEKDPDYGDEVVARLATVL